MSQQQSLIQAMLRGSDRQLYSTSANFKMAVDTLAMMIPAFVDGLAEHAKISDERQREMQRHLMMEPFSLVGFGNHIRVDLTKDAIRERGFPSIRHE